MNYQFITLMEKINKCLNGIGLWTIFRNFLFNCFLYFP